MATVHKVSIKTELDAKQAQAQAEKLHDTIKATKKEAAGISASGDTLAPKSALSPGAKQAKELTEYGQTRAMRPGGTGASARDFAQQAQGLGGLVRLYATYAANLFAVTAAYQALSAAQDTANMVKGLNQLGAASGIALGSLSKQLVKATDGAVSLREAMEATVKASASGMSSKDILRMGEVAKKAAQALGVDMSDALSRISRGITKLEPELLDELGIFTRIDPAVQSYAKSVGKSVSALTQFERQMAFSNAVLAEGEAKFSEINIQTNAYTQLLATLKDTATTVGNALNTVLVPIVGILSSNPSALFVMLTGMAAMIIKQAIPAFADLNQSMRDNQQALVDASANRVKLMQAEQLKMKNVAAEAAKNTFKAYIKDADDAAEAAVSSLSKAQDRLEQLKKNKTISQAAPVQSVIGTDNLTNLTAKQITDLESYAAKLQRLNKKNAVEVQDLAIAARSVYDTHIQYGKAQEMQQAAASKAAAEEEAKLKNTLHYRAANTQLQRESITLQKNLIVAAAGENVHIKGIAGAWREVNASISDYNKQREKGSGLAVEGDRQISRTQANLIKLGGAFSIMTGVISSATSAIAPWIEAIGLAVIAVGFIDMWLDKAAESVGKFNDAVSASVDATKNFSSVIDRYSGAKIDEAFSVKAVEAYSAQLINVADSFDSIEKNAEKARKKLDEQTWSSAKNSIKEFFGFGIAGGEKDAIKSAVESLLVSVKKSPAALTTLNKALSETFGVRTTSNVQDLEEAINKLYADPAKREQLVRIVRATGVELGIAASAQKEFKAAIDKAAESSKTLGDSLKFSQPMLELADAGITALEKLSKTGSTVNDQFDSLNVLFEKSKNLDLFGDSVFTAQELGKELENIRKIYKDNTEAIKLAEAEVSKLQKAETDLTAQYGDIRGGNASGDAAVESATKARLAAEDQLKLLNSQAKEQVSSINALFAKAVAASKNGLDGYYNILEKQITIALSAPLNAFKNAVTSTLGNVKGIADREAQAAFADIGYQKAQLEVELEGILYLRRIAVATELSQATLAADVARRTLGSESTPAARDALNTALKREADAKAKFDLVSKGNPDPKALLSLARETADPEMRKLASIVTGVTQKLAALGDQAGAIRFTQGFKKVGEGLIDENRTTTNKQKDNAKQLEGIDLLKQRQGFLTSEQLLSAENLAIEKINLDTQASRLALVREEKEIQYIINNGKLTKTEIDQQNNRAQDISLAKQRLADSEITKIELERLKYAQERDAKLQKEIAQKYTLLGVQEDIRATEASSSINVLGSRIGTQKDLGIDTGAQDLLLEQMQQQAAYDAARNSAALEFNRTLEQRTSTYSTLGTLEKEAYAEETAAITEKYLAITAGEAAAKAAADARLVMQEQILQVTREQELATLRIGQASESLATVFGSVGEAAGSLLETFTAISQRREKDATKEAELEEIIWSSTASKKDQAKAEQDLNHLKATGAEQAKKDDIALISGAKKLFKEKTFAYKALSAIEKVMHVQKMFAMALELKTMLVNAAASIASALATAQATTAAWFPAITASFAGQLGPVGVGIAAALIASLGGSGSSGSYASAEQLQETQGTGSVLGDETAKNKDIEVGIENLNKLTLFGLNTSQNMLNELEQIAYNTSNLGNTLLRIPGLFGGTSAFGTREKSNPGFLGLFSSSTSIIDSGIKFAQGMFQQYETVQKTSSGFLGIGGGTKTYQNLKPLEQEAQDQLNKLYKDYLGVAGRALEDLGLGAKDLNMLLLESAVDMEKFNVQLKDMSAEEAQAAIQGVFGNVISDALKSTYPFLTTFQKTGEGLLATAIRVSQEMRYVGDAMTLTGMKFKYAAVQASTLSEADVAKAAAARTALANAKAEEANALKQLNDKKMYSQWGDTGPDTEGITLAEEKYAEAKTASQKAQEELTETLGQQQQATIEANIALQQALIDGAGGIEAFSEQIDFFAENFMTQSQRAAGMYSIYNDQLDQTNTKFKDLGLSATMTRQEFSNLVQAQDLNTEAGRKQWQALMDLAPAFDAAKDAMDEFLDSVGMGASTWGDMLDDIMNGDMENIGSAVAETVKNGFYAAMGENFKSQIIAIITEQLITPVITSVISGQVTGALLTQATMDGIVAKIVATAQAYAAVLNDPAFQQAIASISTTVAAAMQGVNSVLGGINKTSFIFQDLDFGDLNAELVQAYKDQRTEIKKTRDELARTIDKFKNFATSIREFKASLLLSAESPLTPAERYAEAKRQFDEISAKAASGDETAMGQVQTAAKALLDASRGMFASGSQYTSDFNMVQQVLDSLAASAESRQTIDELQLAQLDAQILILDSQIAILEDQLDSSKTIEQILAEIRDKESKATQLGIDQTVKGFHVLDKNTDGLLTLDELKSSGMASDKDIQRLHSMMDANGDGQISRLEALSLATEGVAFQLDGIANIMDMALVGTMDSATALVHILEILSNSGGASGEFGGGTGYHSKLGANVYKDKIYGKSGEAVDKAAGTQAIVDYARNVDTGVEGYTAAGLYHILKDLWGMDSGMVAYLLGNGADSNWVNGWFQARDPSLPEFAIGTNYVPEDMTARIHKGERIVPAADNTRLMAAIENKELLKEVQKLNAKIESLEETVAQGALLNANATDRNTDEISRTVKDAGSTASHTEAIRRKVSIK